MQKTVTITFNPCIDKSISVPSLIPEKKLYCKVQKFHPGGGGVNVARALKKLGGNAIAVLPYGGYSGETLLRLLEKEEIVNVSIKTNSDTRENVIVLDQSTNLQYRLGMPGEMLSKKEWQACLNALEKIDSIGFIVVSGSLPLGVPISIYITLAKIAKRKNAKLIVDASGDALKKAIEEGAFLLKPNLNELSSLVGKKQLNINEVKSLAMEIISKGKCEIIIVSLGAKGAMLISKNITEIIVPPAVIRNSTIGAGDSMVAGIVYYLSIGKNILDAAKYGVACGTAATMNLGTELCKKEDVEKLYNEINKN
jgi:6-phosphofructokinase 2